MPFGKLNKVKAAAQVQQDMEERGSGQSFFSAKAGVNNIRILPPAPDSDDVFVKAATHWGIGANKENFNCPRAANKEADCFLCETSYRLTKSKDEDDQATGDLIRAKKQWLYNIIDLDDEDAGFQVAAFGVTIHEDIGAYIEDAGNEYGDITDPEEGTNLILTKTGKGMKTKYDVRAKRKSSPLPEALLELLETESPADLNTVRPLATNAKMKAAWEGGSDDVDDDDADDEPQVLRKTRGAPTAGKVKPADDDEDDDDEDDAPAAKKPARRGRPAAAVDDDDDDDAPFRRREARVRVTLADDDDDDDAPKKPAFGSKLGQKRAKKK